jgi:hypothetical protein
MLWQHDPGEPVGPLAVGQRGCARAPGPGQAQSRGRRAREIAALIGEGGLDGLSIGFRVVEAAKGAGGIRKLVKLDLWEISIVTFPMLPGARLGTVKTEPLTSARRGEVGLLRRPCEGAGRTPSGTAPPSPNPSPTRQREPVAPSLSLAIRRASARLSRPATT